MAGFDDITVTRSDGRLKVKAPYNPLFARRSRALGGTFDDKLKTWTFNVRVERLVFEALDKYFWWHKGVDAEKRVTLTIDPYDYLYAYSKQDSDIIWFAGRILVEKYQPDRPPRMMPNVALVDGMWPKTGLYTGLNLSPDKLRLLVWDVPTSFPERLSSGKYELSEPDGDTLTAVDVRIQAVEERLGRLRELRTRLASNSEDVNDALRAD